MSATASPRVRSGGRLQRSWPARAALIGAVCAVALAVVALATAKPAPVPLGGARAGALVFDDEFDGSALDRHDWATCYSYAPPGGNCTNPGNSGAFLEAQCYTPANVIVDGGRLALAARAETARCDGLGKAYTSGMVQARGSRADRLYGYFEARVKVPAGDADSVGLWPAFWLVPHRNGVWPPELDVFEFYGGSGTGPTGAMARGTDGYLHPQRFTSTFRRLERSSSQRDYYGARGPGSVLWDQAFHVWGLAWRPDYIDVYVDGRRIWHYTGSAIPTLRMYPILDLALRAKYASSVRREVPCRMLVDYVRVWQ